MMRHNSVHGRMFTAAECRQLTTAAAKLPKEPGSITVGGTIDKDARTCHVSWINRSDPSFEWVFVRADAWVQRANDMAFDLNISPNGAQSLQYTMYEVGAHYRIHMDTHMSGGDTAQRKLSFSTLLNSLDDFGGGEFYLHGELVPALQGPGMAVGFPAISQHSIETITRGRRISLVGWYEGPPWR